jgi:hypothetical protein
MRRQQLLLDQHLLVLNYLADRTDGKNIIFLKGKLIIFQKKKKQKQNAILNVLEGTLSRCHLELLEIETIYEIIWFGVFHFRFAGLSTQGDGFR